MNKRQKIMEKTSNPDLTTPLPVRTRDSYDSYRQPLGASFWTKCPRCGYLQCLDQGLWGHANGKLIYNCANCSFQQMITTSLVDLSDPEMYDDPVVDVRHCQTCGNASLYEHSSGKERCVNPDCPD